MDTSWRIEALCATVGDEERKMFFGDREGMSTHRQHKEARQYCYSCPVQVECLLYSIEADERFGIWGGLTESQRKRYLNPRLRQARRNNEEITPDLLVGVIVLCAL